MSAKTVILTRKGAMLQGALAVFLKPRIAKDTKLDYGKLLSSVTAKNFASKKGSIVAGVKEQTRGKLAKDANVDGLVTLLDALEDIESPEAGTKDALETDPNSGAPLMGEKHTDEEDESMDADPHAGLKAYLQDKGMTEDDIEGACNAVSDAALGTKEGAEEGEDEDMDAEDNADGEGEGGKEDAAKMAKAKDKKGAKDEPPPFKGKPEVGGGKAMSKDAVNLAIKRATDTALTEERQRNALTREAERFVRPWVGDLAMAHDSAEAVFRTALTALGEDVKGVHPSAYKSILKRIPQPNAKRVAQDESLGMDSESTSDFHKRYPAAKNIGFA